MKKIKLLSFVLATLVAGFVMTSCEKDEEIQIPEISFENATYTVSETSTSALEVTITSDIPAPQALTIGFTVSGTAVSGENYVAFSSNVNVSQGASEATILINPINVPAIEDSKTIILTLTAANTYELGDTGISTTITIQDNNVAANDAPTVQFTSGDVIENAYLQDTVKVMLGLDEAFDAAMLIPLELSGDAVEDTDFEILDLTSNKEIEFEAGETAAEFRVVVKYNNVADLDVDLDIAFADPLTTAYAVASTNNTAKINFIDPTADMSAWFNEANKFNYSMAGGTSLSYRTWEEMPAYDVKRYYWDLLDNGGDYNLLSMDHHFYYHETEHNMWKEVINYYQKQVGYPSVDIVEQERWELVGGDFLGMTKYFANEAKFGRSLMESLNGWIRFVVVDPSTPGEGIVVVEEQTITLYKEADATMWDDRIYNAENTEYYYGWYADATTHQADMSQSSIVTPVTIEVKRAEGTFSNSSSEIIFEISFTVSDVDLDIDEKYYTNKEGDTYTMKIKYINAKSSD